MKHKFILVLIVLLGLMLRVAFINSSPLSLYGDELTIALDAYSLLQTGHDQLGNLLPLTFPMGAGRPAGYVYGSIPFIAIFGPTALGVRSLSILSGVGIIILLYLIGKRLFSEKVGLVFAAVTAVSPWEISLSRGGFEAHFALFLALVGIYLFILANRKSSLYLFSAISFGLTLHTYPTYKVSLLLFLPLLIWYTGGIRDKLKNKHFLIGVIILVVLGILALTQTFTGGSEARFANINIFSQDKLKGEIDQKINYERQLNNLPQNLAKYFHNKDAEYAKVFIENYLQNFSLDFLVLHGDRNPRHNMATTGEIYVVEIILIIAGLLTLWPKNKKTTLFLLFWITLSPVSTAIVDLPHALRSSFMLPPLIILSSLGIVALINYRNKVFLFLAILAFFIQFIFFIQKLYFLAPNEYNDFWSYQAKIASDLAIQNKNQYKYTILSDQIDNIEFAYPVYAKVSPNLIISQNKNKTRLNGYEFKNFGNIYIGHLPDGEVSKFLKSLDGSSLYIGGSSAKNTLDDYELIEDKLMKLTLVLKRISKN